MEPALEIAQSAASIDPDVGLRTVASLRALTERLEIVQVENARELGWSCRLRRMQYRPGLLDGFLASTRLDHTLL